MLATKTQYLKDVNDPWISTGRDKRVMPPGLPGSRGLPTFVSAGGTNQETFNGVIDIPVAGNNTGADLATAVMTSRTVEFVHMKYRGLGIESNYYHDNRELVDQVNEAHVRRYGKPKYENLVPLRPYDNAEVVVADVDLARHRHTPPADFQGVRKGTGGAQALALSLVVAE